MILPHIYAQKARIRLNLICSRCGVEESVEVPECDAESYRLGMAWYCEECRDAGSR